eukprot:12917436-Prorocentrum_lima.AAC.1
MTVFHISAVSTINTVAMEFRKESKFARGTKPFCSLHSVRESGSSNSSKQIRFAKICIPRRVNMNMIRKRRTSSEAASFRARTV